jgi:hypothetical protein
MLKRKSNTEIVIRALLNGYSVKLNGLEYRMGEDYSIGTPVQDEKAIFSVPWTLKDFITVCQKLDDKYIVSLVSSMTLNEYKKV